MAPFSVSGENSCDQKRQPFTFSSWVQLLNWQLTAISSKSGKRASRSSWSISSREKERIPGESIISKLWQFTISDQVVVCEPFPALPTTFVFNSTTPPARAEIVLLFPTPDWPRNIDVFPVTNSCKSLKPWDKYLGL